MKIAIRSLVLGVASSAALSLSGYAVGAERGHGVFVMTNDAQANTVIAYVRTDYGALTFAHAYRTGGRGSGGKIDPLGSQGSLRLSDDNEWLFAVNAASGTLSVFRVRGSELDLSDEVSTGGAEPVSVTQHGNLVYVLNAAGSSSLVGFYFKEGRLLHVDGSQRYLSANGANPGAVAFSPDGRFVLAVEKANNAIDVFKVEADGTLSTVLVNASAGPGAFAVGMTPNGTAIVSETGHGGTTAAISSYHIGADGALTTVSASVPTLGAADCWNVTTPDGRFVYASNAGTSSISGFAVSEAGVLTPLPGTTVGLNPANSTNLDLAISANGKFLYSLNTGSGTVGAFAISGDGSLTALGSMGRLPAGSSLNGMAAN